MSAFEDGLNGTTAEDLKPSYEIRFPPPPVGWWILPGSSEKGCIKFSGHKRPRWLTRKMMEWVFEWKWEDADGQAT